MGRTRASAKLQPALKSRLATQDVSEQDSAFLLTYLEKYGYVQPNALVDDHSLRASVRLLQRLLGFHASGVPDPKTLRALRVTPRCACPDRVALREAATAKWNKRKLTWRVQKYLAGLTQNEQDQVFAAAWQSWAAVCDMKFEKTSDQRADITITTSADPRTGLGGAGATLAYAYLPTGNDRPLQMVFDEAETWLLAASQAARGVLLLNVAAHEFGHLIGLQHSQVRTALMAPFYSPAVGAPQEQDDVPRIRVLYGPAKADPGLPPEQPPLGPLPPKRRTLDLTAGDFTAAGLAKVRAFGDRVTIQV